MGKCHLQIPVDLPLFTENRHTKYERCGRFFSDFIQKTELKYDCCSRLINIEIDLPFNAENRNTKYECCARLFADFMQKTGMKYDSSDGFWNLLWKIPVLQRRAQYCGIDSGNDSGTTG